MTVQEGLFNRKCTLQISNAAGLTFDLSEFRIVFHVEAHDAEFPGTAVIRIYNLEAKTVNTIQTEFQVVTLQAGYQNGPFGAIFVGSIKQFRIGKEDAVSTYLDLLCADNDIAYNASAISQSFASGWTAQRVVAEVVSNWNTAGDAINHPESQMSINDFSEEFLQTAGLSPGLRGKVMYGATKNVLKSTASALNCSWSIQKGVLQIIPFNQYLDSEVVELTQFSGVVGIPEVTNEGIKIKCLMNPKISVGGTIKLNNTLINNIVNSLGNLVPPGASGGSHGLAYNAANSDKNAVQFYANVGLDAAVYRVLVVEYEGDTRGHPWYTNIIALLADPSSKTVIENTQGG